MPPAPGETYVICRGCGARLHSVDDRGWGPYKDVPCPYKKDEDGECVSRDERPDLYG